MRLGFTDGGTMKGMLNLLERAGLVSRVDEESSARIDAEPSDGARPAADASSAEPALPLDQTTGLSLSQVYSSAGIQPCAYPAERLLRLIDGLKAMDDATRSQTIQAIDAADDSWSIDDPKRDAAAKVAAIERHAASIRAGVAQDHRDTEEQLKAIARRQDGTVAEIRRQVAELEGLLAREIARGTQETSALEAALQSRRDGANRELAALAQTAQVLSGLIAHFNSNTTK
jgi:hypothetical protein